MCGSGPRAVWYCRGAVTLPVASDATMQAQAKKIVLRIDAPRPCRSGKAIEVCHLDFDGRLRKPRPSLRPPGERSGFSHSACYLRGTCDCSEQISREHYISRGVLEQLGSMLRISGVPWLRSGQTLETTVENLTAKILCRRHNAAVSPLDDEAAHFFSTLTDMLLDLSRKTLSRRPIFHLVGGEALELWMLKVACGIYFSVAAKDNVRVTGRYYTDLKKVEWAFFDGVWDNRAALHFRGETGSVVDVAHGVGVARLTRDHDLRFGGATMTLNGLMLEIVFDTSGTNPGPWSGLVMRPSEVVWTRQQREHHIILTWPSGTPEASVTLRETFPSRARAMINDA